LSVASVHLVTNWLQHPKNRVFAKEKRTQKADSITETVTNENGGMLPLQQTQKVVTAKQFTNQQVTLAGHELSFRCAETVSHHRESYFMQTRRSCLFPHRNCLQSFKQVNNPFTATAAAASPEVHSHYTPGK